MYSNTFQMYLQLIYWLTLTLLIHPVCIAQESVDQAADSISWMHTASFPHRWAIGDQTFHIRESALATLLTIDELRAISHAQQPLPPQQIRTSNDFVKQPATVQLASFEQEVDDETEAGAKDSPPASINADESTEPTELKPVVTGATIYYSLDIEELQEVIKAQKEIIASDDQLGDAVKASRLQMLASANEAILKRNELDGVRYRFQTEIDQLGDEEESLRSRLNNPVEPGSPTVDESTMSETLIREIEERRRNLDDKKQTLIQLDEKIQFHTERVSKIAEDRSRAEAALEAARQETNRLLAETDGADNKIALILQELRYRAATEELKKLDVEVERQALSTRVDPIERDLASRDVKRLEVEIERWQAEIKKLREKEVQEEQQQASQASETAAPRLKPLAERNEALVNELKLAVEATQLLGVELKKVTEQFELIVERRTDIQNKIEAAGLTGTNGMLLVDLRRTLASTGESYIRIRQLQAELRKVNLSKVSLIDERDELDDPLGAVKKFVDSDDPENPLVKKALQFIQTKREYLYQIIEDYQSYGRNVSEVSQTRKKLIDEINATIRYIDENALWIKSSEPLSLKSFASNQGGENQFFDLQQWNELAVDSQNRATEKPYESTLFVIFLVGLVVVNRRIKKKIERPEPIDE